MSITDELRDITKDYAGYKCIMFIEKGELFAIADRIDIEHERECKEQYACGAEHGIAASIEASMLQDNGYIALPKDVDGVPIHIGDELDGYGYPNGGAYCKAILNEVMILAGPKDSGYRSWLMWDATEVRHHKPTIEDVLREFGEKYCDMVDGCAEESELFAEYAAKLQLKETE